MVSDIEQNAGEQVDSSAVSKTPLSNQERAEKIVRSHTLWAAGMGLIPVPGLDVAGVAGAQYTMIGELAKLYGLNFSNERIRALAASLLGGGLPSLLTTGGVASVFKVVPVVGTLLGAAVMPALSAAATLALGRVFVQHFEAGGTLLDFKPEKMRSYFRDEFEKARGDASNMLANAGASAGGHRDEIGRPNSSALASVSPGA
jgi:uncharacterized protein (DUF697 family)